MTAPPPSLEAYLAIPHALVSPAGLQHGVIDDALAREGSSRRRVSVSVARFSTLPFLLKGARLLTNMPAVSAVHYARAFDLACLKLPIASPTFGVALVWYARDAADPARLGSAESSARKCCGSGTRRARPRRVRPQGVKPKITPAELKRRR